MATENKPISEIANDLPKYTMRKDKLTFEGNLDNLFNKLKDRFNNALIDEKDGIRFDWPDSSWIHIRPSNTEPILRIIGEARTQKDIDALFAETKLTLEAK